MLGKLSWFCLTSLITLVLLMWKWTGLFLREKPSFNMLGSTFSSRLDWGSYIICNAKTASKKIGALIHSMKFLSPEVALNLYKSTIRRCVEYCYYIWAGALVATWNCQASCKNEYAGLLVLHWLLLLNPGPAQVFSIGITLVGVLQNWLTWFYFLFLKGGLLIILIDCMIFLSPFVDVTRTWGNEEIFLGGDIMKKCDHDCDQALIKSSQGSVQSIHILVSSCFGYIRLSL